MNQIKVQLSIFKVMGILLLFLISTGCEPETIEKNDPEKPANFIPQKNKKYRYKIESEGSPAATSTQWITNEKDSAGITVFNLHTELESAGNILLLDHKLFSHAGKTYHEIVVPEVWNQTIKMFGSMPNITIKKAELFGFPAWMTMENTIKENSVLSLTGPLLQGQRLKYTNHGDPSSLEQNLLLESGISTVETIEVPAGTFVCNKFMYGTRSKTIQKNKDGEFTSNGEETISVWVAHGIGIVKQENSSRLVTIVVLPTGEIKELVTTTTSKTTLQEIN